MARATRTRLDPDARREDILRHARRLFAEHGYASVSASGVARAAGVTPALVHHYFPGKRALFLALLDRLVPQVIETTRVDTTKPPRTRVENYADNWFEWVEANHETWLATAAQGEHIPDPEVRAAVNAAREGGIDGIIASYPESLSDTPQVRLMLRSFFAFNRSVLRSWLGGETSRTDAWLLLVETLHTLITTVAPTLANGGAGRANGKETSSE